MLPESERADHDEGLESLSSFSGFFSSFSTSFVAFLKFLIPLPMPDPISGSLPAPKMMRIITSMTSDYDRLFYTHEAQNDPFYDNVDNSTGYVVEARLKVIETDGSHIGQVMAVRDGSYEFKLSVYDDKIKVYSEYIAEPDQYYYLDTTDSYHVYRIAIKGDLNKSIY